MAEWSLVRMMSYQALYRKYRPRKFADVIGQDHITRTLKNALIEKQVVHAYLFSGPRGTGKTTVARILAAAVNCRKLKDGEPCGKCDSCKSIAKGTWGLIEIDGASNNSVEDIRELQARIHSVPIHAKRQVYIIDEVHQLSASAFNAFLKTLEEPPEHAMFILATTEPGKLLPTVMSRCQHYPFRRIPANAIAAELKRTLEAEKIPYEEEAASLIARLADGAMRDALSVLDQLIAFDRSTVTLENCRKVLGTVDEDLLFGLAESMLQGDSAGILTATEGFAAAGRDYPLVLKDLTGLFRDCLIASLDKSALAAEGRSEEYCTRAVNLKGELGVEGLSKIIATLARKSGEMRYELEKRILFETSLLELSQRLTKALHEKKSKANPPQASNQKASATATAPVPDETTTQDDANQAMVFPGAKRESPTPEAQATQRMESKPASAPSIEPPPEDAIEITDPIAEWNLLLRKMARASIAKAALLKDGKPLSFEDDMLRLEYPPEKALMGHGMNEPLIKDETERILSDILDRPVFLEIELKRPKEKGTQAGLFEGDVDPDVAELKGIIESQILSRIGSARIHHIEKTES